MAAIEEGLEDVLLHGEVIVVDGRERAAQLGEVIDGFANAVVGDVVGGCFGAQDEMVADVLFDEAVAVMTADHRVGQMHVLDLCLQLTMVQPGDLATEDGGDLVWPADGAIGVEEPLAELVEGGAAMEDEIVAELGLGEKQPVSAAGVIALVRSEERRERGEPFLAASNEVARRQRSGQFPQALGLGAPHEGVRALVKVHALLAHSIG